MTKKILNTRQIRQQKKNQTNKSLCMLTCYDFQTAQLLDETDVDIILVGDSLGNVILGYETTLQVSIEEMLIFAKAVKRGAPNTFTVVDMPFGSYMTLDEGLKNAAMIFQKTKAQAVKIEGAFDSQCSLINRLCDHGVAVMGHIGLQPQSVHQQGGYFLHGKDHQSAQDLIQQAKAVEQAGAFAIVLECIKNEVAQEITQTLNIPTIGIGSGDDVDGQVLVINDLMGMGKDPTPSFCRPRANIYQLKKEVLDKYIRETQQSC